MSEYYDPEFYEQSDIHNTNTPSSQQPAPNGFYISPSEAEALDGDEKNVKPGRIYETLPPPPESRAKKIIGQITLIAIIVVIAFFAGWFSHQAFGGNVTQSSDSRQYSALIQQAWDIIDQNYVDRKAVNYKQMSYKAIQAMVTSLGDTGHSRFLTPADVQAENQSLSGSFVGIGIHLRQDVTTKQVIITDTIPGSPAQKSGLKGGDIIVAVNGVSTVGKDIAGISAMIKGQAGTSVSLTVQRPSTHKTLTFTMVRAQITVPNVIMHYIAQDHIAHIQIVQFSDGESAQLADALAQAKKLGATKVILDLREDPGGYLKEAVNTASEFMQSGNVLLEQDSTGNRTPYPVTGNTIDTHDEIVVLVNSDTASAAEIVSGSLQDNHRAIVMGVKTFGTGTVLQQFNLDDGSAILLGTAEWLTPNGHFIRNQGITPNIPVTMGSKSIILTPSDENDSNMSEQQILNSGDTQLNAAIHYLETH